MHIYWSLTQEYPRSLALVLLTGFTRVCRGYASRMVMPALEVGRRAVPVMTFLRGRKEIPTWCLVAAGILEPPQEYPGGLALELLKRFTSVCRGSVTHMVTPAHQVGRRAVRVMTLLRVCNGVPILFLVAACILEPRQEYTRSLALEFLRALARVCRGSVSRTAMPAH